jgi:MerR family transcriptional regulator, light-induced transcriptional regulator
MEFYQINDLEKLTGIKAHTIRIWEKRFNLIEPYRTQTNIRYYDNQQVKKLLNIVTLLDCGYKISKIAVLPNSELVALIKGVQADVPSNAIITSFINDMIQTMLVFDESLFDKIFSAAVNRLGMYQAMLQVFYPFLHKTGMFWTVDETMPVQEHFASNIIKRKLMSAIDALSPATKFDKKFLLFLPNDEWHEIALLFSDYLVRSNGYTSIYLGQNVPTNDMEYVIKTIKPTHLLSFFISTNNQLNPKLILSQLLKAHKKMICLVSGSQNHLKNLGHHKSIFILNEPGDILKFF